ncbi:DUF2934 domain-containing protein [Bradyrhizobium sp. USDA 4449]
METRAHDLWEQAGRPGGRDLDFWLEAERESGGNRARLLTKGPHVWSLRARTFEVCDPRSMGAASPIH